MNPTAHRLATRFQAIYHTHDEKTMAIQSDKNPTHSLLVHLHPMDQDGWISASAQRFGPDKTRPEVEQHLPVNDPSNLQAFKTWVARQAHTLLSSVDEQNEVNYWLKQQERFLAAHMKDPEQVWSD
jgi:hypothetical protein